MGSNPIGVAIRLFNPRTQVRGFGVSGAFSHPAAGTHAHHAVAPTAQTEPRDASGTIYLRARHYDPALGRFLSRDPLPGSMWDAQTQNPYAYAGNNPVTRSDPTGMCWWDACLVEAALVATAVAAAAGAYYVWYNSPAGEAFRDAVDDLDIDIGQVVQGLMKQLIDEATGVRGFTDMVDYIQQGVGRHLDAQHGRGNQKNYVWEEVARVVKDNFPDDDQHKRRCEELSSRYDDAKGDKQYRNDIKQAQKAEGCRQSR